jgi:hypothetical protein
MLMPPHKAGAQGADVFRATAVWFFPHDGSAHGGGAFRAATAAAGVEASRARRSMAGKSMTVAGAGT